MIKISLLLSAILAISFGLPTRQHTVTGKNIGIVSDSEDLRTAKTFYTGYNTAYPNVGLSSGQRGGAYGWRGDNKPSGAALYGSGFEIGYGGLPVAGYAAFVPGPVIAAGSPIVAAGRPVIAAGGPIVGGGGPVITGGGGYGWRQGVNRWTQ